MSKRTDGPRQGTFNRRSFLAATGLAAATASAPRLAGAQAKADSEAAAPASALETLGRELRARTGTPPSCDGSVTERRLPDADEHAEVALGRLWLAFAEGASVHILTPSSADVDWPVVARARSYVRPVLLAEARSGPVSDAFLASHLTRWRDLGDEAAREARWDPIDLNDFNSAWEDVAGDPPADQGDLTGRDWATEVIGNHLWFRFQMGLLSGTDKPADSRAIVEKGRVFSRRSIWTKLVPWGVYDATTGAVDLGTNAGEETWKWQKVGGCAYFAGRRTMRWARSAQSVDAGHFDSGWCEVKDVLDKHMEKNGKELAILSGACGG